MELLKDFKMRISDGKSYILVFYFFISIPSSLPLGIIELVVLDSVILGGAIKGRYCDNKLSLRN